MQTNYTPNKNNPLIGDVLPPSIGPGNFGQWANAPQGRTPAPVVHPLHKAGEFLAKYSVVAVFCIMIALGMILKTGQDWATGLLLTGALLAVSFFAYGTMENIFDRDSGHVVWAYFGWKVERKRIEAEQAVMESWHKVLIAREETALLTQANLEAQREQIVSYQARPQGDRNRLANYAEPVHPPVAPEILADLYQFDPESIPVETNNGTEAKRILLEFVNDLYLNPDWTNDEGLLSHQTPWAKSAPTSEPIKKQIKDMLRQIKPSLFSFDKDNSRLWRHHFGRYPAAKDANEAIGKCLVGKV